MFPSRGIWLRSDGGRNRRWDRMRDGVTESVVGVGGNGFTGGIEVAGDVAVVVVERDVD